MLRDVALILAQAPRALTRFLAVAFTLAAAASFMAMVSATSTVALAVANDERAPFALWLAWVALTLAPLLAASFLGSVQRVTLAGSDLSRNDHERV